MNINFGDVAIFPFLGPSCNPINRKSQRNLSMYGASSRKFNILSKVQYIFTDSIFSKNQYIFKDLEFKNDLECGT